MSEMDYDPNKDPRAEWRGAMERHAAHTEYNTRRTMNASRFIAWILVLFVVCACGGAIWEGHEISRGLSVVEAPPVTGQSCLSQGGTYGGC